MRLKFLIIEPKEAICKALKKNAEDYFGASVIEAKDFAEASVLLSINQFNLIICKPKTHLDENLGQAILNFLFDKNSGSLVLFLGEFDHPFKKYQCITNTFRLEEINRTIVKMLNLDKDDLAFLKLPDYVGYPIQYFYLMTFSPCEVFIRLIKKDGDEYVKRFHEAETFTRQDLAKYEMLGLKEFYIQKHEMELFLNAFVMQTIQNSQNVSDEKSVDVLENTFSISTDMMRKMGIGPESKAIADQTINQMVHQVTKSSQLGKMLKKIMDNQGSFSYRRSYLITLLASRILPHLEWGGREQDGALLLKFSMVSFFHDIFLEDEKLLKINSLSQYEQMEFSLSYPERDLVLNHANKAALLLQSYPKLPAGVDILVKQHHGVGNGVGFPDKWTISISPMAIVFIVLEEFATRVLLSPDQNYKQIVKKCESIFHLPTYRKVLHEIEAMLNQPL